MTRRILDAVGVRVGHPIKWEDRGVGMLVRERRIGG